MLVASGSGGGSGSGCGSNSNSTVTLKVTTSATTPEGGVAVYKVTVGGGNNASYPTFVHWELDATDTLELGGNTIGDSDIEFDGPGTTTIAVKLSDDGYYGNGDEDQSGQTVSFLATDGSALPALTSATTTVNETQDQQTYCDCNCGCPSVEPEATPSDGAPTGHSPLDVPGAYRYNGGDKPHPIISTNDVLSSTVASATDVMTQVTLMDDSGNTVYTGTPVYYSPAGYTPGEAVKFAQQIDAGLLTPGRYQWTMTVTEEYGSGNNVTRAYSGFTQVRNLDQTPYGSGWMLAGVDKLSFQTDGVDLTDDAGNQYTFVQNPDGSYLTPDLLTGETLVKNSDGTFTLTSQDHSTMLFSASGQMTSYTTPVGNTTSYTYNSDGTIATMTDPAGRTTTYAYTNGQLTSATDFAGRATTYTYNGTQLASITEPAPGYGEPTPVTSFTYDPTTGLLATITDASGTKTLYYDKWRALTEIKNPDGSYKLFSTPDDQGIVDTSTGVGTQSNPAPLFYASQVDGTQTDENGNVTHYVTGVYGEVTSSTDAKGNTTTFQYNAAGQIAQMTQPPLTQGGANLVTTYHYDANGNLIEEDLPDGSKETWTYDPTFNEVTSYIDPAGRETDYSINAANGEIMSMTQVSTAGNRVTSFTYTTGGTGQPPAGLVASITDPRGIVTAITYNTHGLPTQIVYAQGTADQASVSYTYDSNDNPATYVDELSRTTNFTYDNLNRLIQTVLPPPDPNNPTVRPTISKSYDALSNVISESDPLSNVTTFSYNNDNQLTQIQQPDPAGGTNYTITKYGYDLAGNLTTTTDPMGRITTYGYDGDNRQTSVQLPNPVGGGAGGPTSSVVYDALGDVIKSFDDKGAETDYTYDAMGRVLTTTGPAPTQGAAQPVTTYTYNADGQVLTETDPMGHETQYQYDDFGELTQETLPDPDGAGPLTSTILKWSYDPDGNMASATDGLNHTTTYAYNNRNWKTSETDPLSGVTHYGYDAAGNMTSLQDPAGNSTTFVFDGLNRVTSETNQLNQTRSFVYDLNGNLIQETDRDGRVRDFSYDHLNRQTAEQWMSGSAVLETFSYSYNADGQLTSADSPDSAYAYSYDGMGRVSSVDNNGTPNVPDVVLSSQYDANSNRTSLSATIAGTADFQNVYTYDALNRLTQLYQQGQTGGNAVAVKGANLTYNLLGQLATVARTNFFGIGPAPDIATSTFSYDNANRLTEIANTTNGGTAIDAYSWTYDNANRVTSMTTTTDGTAAYSYDNTNQVTGATYTTNPGATQPANETYSYDSNGNRTNTGYSTGTNNQLTSDGTFNYTYDAEGNRITRTRISNSPANDYLTTYTWDYRDRLTDVYFYNNSDVLTKHVHYTYDVFDHLIGKQVDDTGGGTYDRAEFYVYDGNNVVLQFDASGNLTERYLNGPSASGVDNVLAEEDVTSLSSPGNVTWPLTDNLGTVRDIVDSTGAVIDHLVYNSFGQVAYESASTVHHFEGYTSAIYDADTGMTNNWHRWYDPAVGRWVSEDPIGFAAGDTNLSRYVGSDATNSNDPTGLQAPNGPVPDKRPGEQLTLIPGTYPVGTVFPVWNGTYGVIGSNGLINIYDSQGNFIKSFAPGQGIILNDCNGRPIRFQPNQLPPPIGSITVLPPVGSGTGGGRDGGSGSERRIEGGGGSNPKTGDLSLELGYKGKRGNSCYIEFEIPPDAKEFWIKPGLKITIPRRGTRFVPPK